MNNSSISTIDTVTRVQLRAAKIPWIGWLAHHCWFVVQMPTALPQRWEVWQTRNLTAACWGHLYYNLLQATAGVGNGESWLLAEWTGSAAQQLAQVLTQSPTAYPYCFQYRYWPGPNSNTFVQWILRESGVDHSLPWQSIGKNFLQ